MCRIVLTRRLDGLRPVLEREQALAGGDGFGIGFIGRDGRPVVARWACLPPEEEYLRIARAAASAIVIHLRHAETGPTTAKWAQPVVVMGSVYAFAGRMGRLFGTHLRWKRSRGETLARWAHLNGLAAVHFHAPGLISIVRLQPDRSLVWIESGAYPILRFPTMSDAKKKAPAQGASALMSRKEAPCASHGQDEEGTCSS